MSTNSLAGKTYLLWVEEYIDLSSAFPWDIHNTLNLIRISPDGSALGSPRVIRDIVGRFRPTELFIQNDGMLMLQYHEAIDDTNSTLVSIKHHIFVDIGGLNESERIAEIPNPSLLASTHFSADGLGVLLYRTATLDTLIVRQISPNGTIAAEESPFRFNSHQGSLNGFRKRNEYFLLENTRNSGLFAHVYTLDNLLPVEPIKSFLPQRPCLFPAYPNPFNPSTIIDYDLPERVDVSLVIYDVTGRQVQTLVSRAHQAGTYEASWDGTDKHGYQVAAGMYFARLQAGEFHSVVKMVYLR